MYAHSMDVLRVSAAHLVESVGNAIDEARLLGADRVVIEFETMQQGIADTRDPNRAAQVVSLGVAGNQRRRSIRCLTQSSIAHCCI